MAATTRSRRHEETEMTGWTYPRTDVGTPDRNRAMISVAQHPDRPTAGQEISVILRPGIGTSTPPEIRVIHDGAIRLRGRGQVLVPDIAEEDTPDWRHWVVPLVPPERVRIPGMMTV
jgi:hypothetical protein